MTYKRSMLTTYKKSMPAAILTSLLCLTLTSGAVAAVACSAVGEAVAFNDSYWRYYITVTWDFHDAAIPDRFSVSLSHLDDCPYYSPDIPEQQNYVQLRRAYSTAEPGCIDVDGNPQRNIYWEPELVYEDPDCWMPGRHLQWENDGLTADCEPVTADSATLQFLSKGIPIGPDMYYDAILIKASDGTCVICDYFGSLPDCNDWVPVETSSWGTVKALYR